MEALWFAQRAALRCLSRQHPDWSQEELAAEIGRSRSWVAKWLARFQDTAPADLSVLHARSRARHTQPPATPKAVVERILSIRDEVRHEAAEIIAHSFLPGRDRACCSTNSTLGGEAVR